MNLPATRPVPAEVTDPFQSEFLAVLPKVEAAARLRLRHVACADRRRDLLREAVALAWAWHLRLVEKGRSASDFPAALASLAARAVLSGRRLCGCERARDALSPVCQMRRGFTVSPLPAGSSMIGNAFDEALIDNTRTPVPDQVQFRLDFPRWRASLDARKRALVDAMAAGERTSNLAQAFGLTPSRISQMRLELHENWLAFCDE